MEDSVRDALLQAEELKTRESLAALLKTIKGASLTRTQLVTDITTAPERFMQAQTALFRARKPSNLPDLETRILPELVRAHVKLLAKEAEAAISALYPPTTPRIYDLNSVFALLLERRADDVPIDEEPGEIMPFEPPEDQFSETLIRETQDWLARKFANGESFHVDELLALAEDEGLETLHRRCLTLMLFRCFADSETLFPNVQASADGYFYSDIGEGTNLKFDKREGA